MATTTLKQTTYRIDPEVLRKARLYLDREAKTINDYIVEQLTTYVTTYEQEQDQRRREHEHARTQPV